MTNPNNCATCQHKRNPEGGWCYMFRHEPTEVCNIHSRRGKNTNSTIRELMSRLILKKET